MSDLITEVLRPTGVQKIAGPKFSAIIPLPQRSFEPEHAFMHTIEVNSTGESIVKMADVLQERVTIENGDEKPLIDYGLPESGRKLQLRIEWPGYSGITAFIDIKGGVISRLELFKAVAEQFCRFININKDRLGYSNSNAIPYHYIGVRGITFDNLYIMAIHNVSEDVWMAEVFFHY